MTEEEKRQYQDVQLQIALKLYQYKEGGTSGEAFFGEWEKLPDDLKEWYLQIAYRILSLPGIRIEAEDQTLPENPYCGVDQFAAFNKGLISMADRVKCLPKEKKGEE